MLTRFGTPLLLQEGGSWLSRLTNMELACKSFLESGMLHLGARIGFMSPWRQIQASCWISWHIHSPVDDDIEWKNMGRRIETVDCVFNLEESTLLQRPEGKKRNVKGAKMLGMVKGEVWMDTGNYGLGQKWAYCSMVFLDWHQLFWAVRSHGLRSTGESWCHVKMIVLGNKASRWGCVAALISMFKIAGSSFPTRM